MLVLTIPTNLSNCMLQTMVQNLYEREMFIQKVNADNEGKRENPRVVSHEQDSVIKEFFPKKSSRWYVASIASLSQQCLKYTVYKSGVAGAHHAGKDNILAKVVLRMMLPLSFN